MKSRSEKHLVQRQRHQRHARPHHHLRQFHHIIHPPENHAPNDIGHPPLRQLQHAHPSHCPQRLPVEYLRSHLRRPPSRHEPTPPPDCGPAPPPHPLFPPHRRHQRHHPHRRDHH